jgi:hypothetical protein
MNNIIDIWSVIIYLGGRSAFYGEKKLSFKLSGPAPRVKDR